MAAPAAVTDTAGRTNRLTGYLMGPAPAGRAGAVCAEPVIEHPIASRGRERRRGPHPRGQPEVSRQPRAGREGHRQPAGGALGPRPMSLRDRPTPAEAPAV